MQLTYIQANVTTIAPGIYPVYAGRSFLGFVDVKNGKAVGIPAQLRKIKEYLFVLS